MLSDKLITSIIYPYLILFFIAGIFLLFYYNFLIIKYPFLSIKIISGTMDWKGSKGKITPGRAFFSGFLGTIPGTFFGALLAFYISGSNILFLIFLIHLLQTSIEFILSTVSFKFRQRNENGNLETGLLMGIEKYSRIRWIGILYGIISIFSTLLIGYWNLSLLNSIPITNILNKNTIPIFLEPMSIMIFFFIFLILLFNGGIRRIGIFFKIISYFFILILILLSFSIINSFELLLRSIQSVNELFELQKLPLTLLSITLYGIFAEIPSLRLHIFSGFVRTDHSAKQGIASIFHPILQILFLFLLSTPINNFVKENPISIENYTQIVDVIFLLHFKGFYFLFEQFQNPSIKLVAYIVFLLFLFSSFLTIFFIGNMISRQILNRFNIPNFYPVFTTILYFYLSFFFNFHDKDILKNFYKILIFFVSMNCILIIIFALIYHNLGKFELQKYKESYEGGIDFSRDLYLIFFTILPSNLISKLFGIISLTKFPQPIMIWIIKTFAKIYKINLNEVKEDLSNFKNLNSFFIRELKKEVRPIDKRKNILVSPVDGVLSKKGLIEKGFLIQTKGIYYSLKDLIVDMEFFKYFEKGKYCVFYLSPQDYHRIHTPCDCYVEGYVYSPGHLFPVNEPLVQGLYGLFPKNERLVTFLKTKYGRIAMVKVGATNVGKIKVTFDSIETNTLIRRKKAVKFKHKIFYKKGMEIGRFEMGSTVILIFENDSINFLENCIENTKFKFGEAFAEFIKHNAG